jgi:Protein of unknown function (DUF2950)
MINMPVNAVWRMRNPQDAMRGAICALALLVATSVTAAAAGAQKSFASPEAATAALADAVKLNDQPLIKAILGPDSSKLVSSGDPVADERGRAAFLKAYGDSSQLLVEGANQATLVIGKDAWPFPIPLVKNGGGWRFDTRQGEHEILHRRIGRNELAAIQVCQAIVDAEREYAAQDMDGDGVLEYAPRFASTPGKRDGLYWPTRSGGPQSPLGSLLAAAAHEGYARSGIKSMAPYHGYLYRILTKQGMDAPGGAYDYLVKGKMIGGFAVLAYPARYGASGVMTFIVNQDGKVYEKNLGRNTAGIAAKMTAYNPDATWKQTEKK